MALTGILGALTALVIIPLKARPADRTARELKLEKEVERLTSALNYWRDAYRAQESENTRLHEERRQWRAYQPQQGLQNMAFAQQAQYQQGAFAQQFAEALQQNWALAQAQQAQQHMANAQQQGAFARQFDGFCTCVPSRAQVFGNGHGLSAAD